MPPSYTMPSNTYRFFVDPAAIQGTRVDLTDADLAHQLGRVLRLQPGAQVLMLDGSGLAYTVTLTALHKQQVRGVVEDSAPAGGELPVHLTLYVGLMRAERFEWVLQKGTELGASRFVPVQWERGLSADSVGARKRVRWQRIIREAAEQACRARLPTLAEPLLATAALADAAQADLSLLLWEASDPQLPAVPLRSVLRQHETPPAHVALLSGAEGGLTSAEAAAAQAQGMRLVSLGPRILRAETAPLAAAAAVGYEYER